MKDQDIIKAISELAGDKLPECNCSDCLGSEYNYLTSRDAIVPVIEKQSARVCCEIAQQFIDEHKSTQALMLNLLLATPRQLCEALLRATNLWK